jgi:2-polyprenyl-6-methoxyphenol hydroxylase-like FAD-dependent oxidoreductase
MFGKRVGANTRAWRRNVPEEMKSHYDVVVIGAGLAGLSLAAQLLKYTKKTVLLLDKWDDPPRPTQKVGESLVQLSGYYFSKILDLEEYLLINQYLKYNLRFYWQTGTGDDFWKDVSSSSIRTISNIATFQLDRNHIERHLMARNKKDPRFDFVGGVRNLQVDLSENDEPHRITFNKGVTSCRWVVDTSGRSSVLKKKLGLAKESPIKHGATWCWVEGLVNYEKFTDLSYKEILLHPTRQKTGNFPYVNATSHFCGKGRWFWVIPLHGITSLGLVFEHASVNPEEVSSAKKMIEWVCKDWPMFARDLPKRKIVDEGRYISYAHDCKQTISVNRWALAGEAGRFTDPLYSPGSDLIAIYNTLIVDAVETEDKDLLAEKCAMAEQIERAMYEAYVPTYELSYNALGDQEAFTLKYAWELAIYFGFYVMPFANQLFTNKRFMQTFLRNFAIFGPINKSIQAFLGDFFKWKHENGIKNLSEPLHIEYYSLLPLRESETLFYQIGLTLEQAEEQIVLHVERMREFARYIYAHVYAVMVGDKRVLLNDAFIRSLKLREVKFDPDAMRAHYEKFAGCEEVYNWKLNPFALEAFIPAGVEAKSTAI